MRNFLIFSFLFLTDRKHLYAHIDCLQSMDFLGIEDEHVSGAYDLYVI